MARTKQKTISLYLSDDKREALRAAVARSGKLQADLLRDMVDELIARYPPTKSRKGVRPK